MTIREKVTLALKTAMVNKDTHSKNTLRLILSALKDKDIIARGNGNLSGIDEMEVALLLQTMIKQRNASIELYQQGSREDLVEIEKNEISLISNFLPKQYNEEEIKTAVLNAIKSTDANSIKDMGKVIKLLKLDHNGKMDFRIASEIVKLQLS
jgi:uncharacterized protein YqeY